MHTQLTYFSGHSTPHGYRVVVFKSADCRTNFRKHCRLPHLLAARQHMLKEASAAGDVLGTRGQRKPINDGIQTNWRCVAVVSLARYDIHGLLESQGNSKTFKQTAAQYASSFCYHRDHAMCTANRQGKFRSAGLCALEHEGVGRGFIAIYII